ncbi:hypothetical protein LZC95_02970 [Pendulispora brunnea]|uniref:DUF222 domain-containing protein n=1 Tax=Pendulispora brunnea TaxID=2905690 RepID=A0ABZ2KAZ4_9BACT
MTDVVKVAEELASAVDGVDWDGSEVHRCRVRLHEAAKSASVAELTRASEVLVARLARSRVDDADGVAYAAIGAGSLVENGAPPRLLAEVLLAKMPAVLQAARRYADICLADLASDGDSDPKDGIVDIDGRSIDLDLFRAHLKKDRGGASALSTLEIWTLPTVAALTRDRALLMRAVSDGELRRAARALATSKAQWLDVLLGVVLDATWLIVCPMEKRAFHMRVDGLVSNFDLHALVSDVLIEQGIRGERNPPDVIAFIRGDAPTRSTDSVSGSFQFYTYEAGQYDWSQQAHPAWHWVWGEGRPETVPFFREMRTLIVGPQTMSRSWTMPRTFAALKCDVSLVRELSPNEVHATLDALRSSGEAPPR